MEQITHNLHGTLRAGDAATLGETLARALAQGDVVIATGDLDGIDSAIVQVLLSAQKTAVQLERNLQIECSTKGVLAAMCKRLALDEAFEVSPDLRAAC